MSLRRPALLSPNDASANQRSATDANACATPSVVCSPVRSDAPAHASVFALPVLLGRHVDWIGGAVVGTVTAVKAVAVCIYLSMTMSRRVQAGMARWRNEERQALETELKQLADADARLQFERWKQEHEQQIRVDAVQRSLAITKGKVTEHIVPYLPGFDLDPKDIRFLGTPIDRGPSNNLPLKGLARLKARFCRSVGCASRYTI